MSCIYTNVGVGSGEWGVGAGGDEGDGGAGGDEGDKENNQCPIPNAQFPISSNMY